MQQASRFFSDEQRERIQKAVAEAELKTSVEIVPALATASGRYDRPEDIVGLWFGAAFLIGGWFLFPSEAGSAGDWGFSWVSVRLPLLVLALVAGFCIGAAVASQIGWLRRLFTPRAQMAEEVAARAREVFFDGRVHHTERATGILFYISLFERMAAVIADDAVLRELGQSALDELCAQLTTGLRQGDPADGVCGVIEWAGERLSSVLPPDGENPNELPDALVVLD